MESKLQTECNKFLKKVGVPYLHLEKGRGNGKRHRAGVPDIITWLKPISFFELKTKTGKLSEEQVQFEEMCIEQKHLYYVVDDLDIFKSLILSIYKL